jgi:hypothetical protein
MISYAQFAEKLDEVAENYIASLTIPSAAKADLHFTRLTVRLEAAPFQGKSAS